MLSSADTTASLYGLSDKLLSQRKFKSLAARNADTAPTKKKKPHVMDADIKELHGLCCVELRASLSVCCSLSSHLPAETEKRLAQQQHRAGIGLRRSSFRSFSKTGYASMREQIKQSMGQKRNTAKGSWAFQTEAPPRGSTGYKQPASPLRRAPSSRRNRHGSTRRLSSSGGLALHPGFNSNPSFRKPRRMASSASLRRVYGSQLSMVRAVLSACAEISWFGSHGDVLLVVLGRTFHSQRWCMRLPRHATCERRPQMGIAWTYQPTSSTSTQRRWMRYFLLFLEMTVCVLRHVPRSHGGVTRTCPSADDHVRE